MVVIVLASTFVALLLVFPFVILLVQCLMSITNRWINFVFRLLGSNK